MRDLDVVEKKRPLKISKKYKKKVRLEESDKGRGTYYGRNSKVYANLPCNTRVEYREKNLLIYYEKWHELIKEKIDEHRENYGSNSKGYIILPDDPKLDVIFEEAMSYCDEQFAKFDPIFMIKYLVRNSLKVYSIKKEEKSL